MKSVIQILKLLASFTALALAGCSAPRTPKYQQFQQTVQIENAKRNVLPIKRAEYYAENPEGSESDYHFKCGEAYLARGQTDKAYLEFRQTVQINPYHQRALLYLTYFVSQMKDDTSLQIIVRRVRQRDPTNAAILQVAGIVSLQRGDLDNAEQQFKKASLYAPHSTVAHTGLGMVYQRQHEFARAAAELEAARAKEPHHRIILFELANCYWQIQRRKEAMDIFDQCLQWNPDSLELRLSLADFYRKGGEFDRALRLYREARQMAPHYTSVLVEMARTHLWKGDPDAALTCLVKVKQRSKDLVSPEVHQLISKAYLKKDAPARAERELLEGLRRFPRHTNLRLALAAVYVAQRKHDAAIAQYQLVLKVEPELFVAQFRLARAYEAAGKRTEAMDAYRRALSLQPDSQQALNNLAYLYAESGTNLDEALKLARKADRCQRNQPAVLDTLGFIHYQRKEYDKALEDFKQAKALSQGRPTAARICHLALVYNQKGMKKLAAKALAEALKYNPSPKEVAEIQRLLEKLDEW